MNVLGIIPARYASTRFPGKPLALIDGKSMIRRVYEQCLECRDLSRVVVATDSKAIYTHVAGFGGEVVMTSEKHTSGTERCAEVVSALCKNHKSPKPEAVVNIQGDEPFIDPAQISEVIHAFLDPDVQIATLAKRIVSEEDIRNPNVVKVVFTSGHQALYFSRSPIPFMRNVAENEWGRQGVFFRHVGIYGYRPDVLSMLVSLPTSSLEKAESLEQLRWLEAGFQISVEETEYETIAIDTPADLLKITNNPPQNRP
ncbi:MAG TPA: 3-deoxy-manno-octulosonate cytidylyltransferase [Bacteroidales bacterium]|nr:3-deoxy-manno-octulosonate cytidylyltransferase [Bacteroidales bacterium]HPS73709.1 3-deoxy-manno-octulosonate cytidylyltransferase [Bacteroidales bacterium]